MNKHIGTLRIVGKNISDAADLLQIVGFTILNRGYISVTVEGDDYIFSKNLGFIPPGGYFCRDFIPVNPILRSVVDRIEIANPTDYLDV